MKSLRATKIIQHWGRMRWDGVRSDNLVFIRHKKTEKKYIFREIVLREADLVPCFTYLELTGNIVWLRPMAELFDGRWDWAPHNDENFKNLEWNLIFHREQWGIGNEEKGHDLV